MALNSCKLIAFIGTSDAARSKAFYQNQLGLQLVSEDSFALVFDAYGTMLRVTPAREVSVARYTVLGWETPNIEDTVRVLQDLGVVFERFSGLEQDDLAIWTVPGGSDRVAWFKDPDGHILSVSQHASA